ncbi:histidine kinase [Mycolicibacterium austroafricanum]|uniref:HAMP domain-containing sensor histidine kinase n=1 Tax=Mycolicibacterium austroafricanum TaxID=39687 RepID=UPI001CA3672D|nr:histidine kinase [Mycolicibacterium austroafricanum]QZT59848.1 HAMP domain-containing protein [Mycolicibacterium austroafricanum]
MFLINGLIFTLGTLALALSPASVSSRIQLTEVPVLAVGLVIILTANAVLVRSSLDPLDELTTSMQRVDPPQRSDRLDDQGNGDLRDLITSFNSMLDRMEAERASSSAAILAAQESERQRIARELHDEIGQSLTVALLTLKRAIDRAPAGPQPELEYTQQTIRACLGEVRDIARRLRPDALDLGLAHALTALCNEYARATGVSVVTHVGHLPAQLDPQIELVCYRIAQESLTNVARHARPRKVWVEAHAASGELVMRIADDGGGIIREGAGIRGMRERALLVDATVTIASGADGTEVRLRIPLDGGPAA